MPSFEKLIGDKFVLFFSKMAEKWPENGVARVTQFRLQTDTRYFILRTIKNTTWQVFSMYYLKLAKTGIKLIKMQVCKIFSMLYIPIIIWLQRSDTIRTGLIKAMYVSKSATSDEKW